MQLPGVDTRTLTGPLAFKQRSKTCQGFVSSPKGLRLHVALWKLAVRRNTIFADLRASRQFNLHHLSTFSVRAGSKTSWSTLR